MRSAKRLSALFAVVAAMTYCGVASAADTMTNNDASAQNILSEIHTTNQNEISMAKLAMQKAQSKQVKSFANHMIKDHTMADQKVMKLAKQENITLGKMPLTAQQQGQIDKLMAASGEEFDRLYMEANRVGHQQAITMLKDAEQKATDPKVKTLVSKLLPTVEHHEHLAKEIHPDQNTQPST